MRGVNRASRALGAPALLIVLAALLSACSVTIGGLDTDSLEEQIEADIEAQAPGVDITEVDCPDGVQPQAGDVFVCRATADDGSVGTIEVTQTDDEGNVTWEVTDVMEAIGQ